MANPYEVEHSIKTSSQSRTRRPDMSSFFNQLSQIEVSSTRHNRHAVPTPVEVAAADRLVQEQYRALLASAPRSNAENAALLESLIAALGEDIEDPPAKVAGVPQSYLDELERVPKRTLKKTETCPICNECFLDDAYPLVVRLPCHATHKFDLECVGPWLRLQGTCPLDRKVLLKKREVPEVEVEEDEDYDEMFA
ncbi:hypothetical protein PZA11_000294 [Diplocarpon coronariae]|uniref:RING-type domain-containing protein n=1 Tax=Diplocarpon coronariae TaxID=2795749 RepID=A0A218Z4A0_9HELO|nr:hypothetical protein JHW43_006283 [Diplocarpon mali]OWP02085.1 hypothetical protein B2J93_1557 [Marssonina coronariae]